MASFGYYVRVRRGAICLKNYGPYSSCYNRFVRWRQDGIWDQIMEAMAAAHDGAYESRALVPRQQRVGLEPERSEAERCR